VFHPERARRAKKKFLKNRQNFSKNEVWRMWKNFVKKGSKFFCKTTGLKAFL